MQIDQPVAINHLRTFSQESNNLSASDRTLLDGLFIDDKTDDFYCDLIAGYANGYHIAQSGVPVAKVIAYLADRLVQKEIF